MTIEVDTVADLSKVADAARNATGEVAGREFDALEDGEYQLRIPTFGLILKVGRLRHEKDDLIGEVCVLINTLPSNGGTLSVADLNLSSAKARYERAKYLAELSKTETLNWIATIEELCQYVVAADRRGQAAVDLRTLSLLLADDLLNVEGVPLLQRHPSIIFGDGGAAKSYLCLYLIGCLAERGMRVALFDWELAGEDHRDRLELLFGATMPKIIYARCEKPLTAEVDRLRRIVHDGQIEFALFDSVAFACDGPPESAEVAARYFRAVRQIGTGSLHIAHVSRGENADQKPFGSAFWHNGARSTWFAKLASEPANRDTLKLGLFNRKANLGSLQSPIGFALSFSKDRTTFTRTNVADNPDLAKQLTIRDRMVHSLGSGAMAVDALAEEIEAELDSVKRTARRHKGQFVMLERGRIGLVREKQA